jgi:GT2 family glycosyltransferase
VEEPIRASVIVCTLDRGPEIAWTVDSLVAQDVPAGSYEILLVDNASRPENAALLREQAVAHEGLVRYVREDDLGLSVARSRGLRESRGEFVLFVDDDAIAKPGWLRAYFDAFASSPGSGAFGGPISLRFEHPPPPWFDDSLRTYVGHFDHGEKPCQLSYEQAPRGGNMAFRRRVLEEVGGFSEHFGRKGRCLLSLEEIELAYRIESSSWRLEYVPGARVEHIVRADRFEPGWFARRIYWQGRSVGVFDVLHRGRGYALRKLPGKLLGVLRKSGLRRWQPMGYIVSVLRHLLSPPSRLAPARPASGDPA